MHQALTRPPTLQHRHVVVLVTASSGTHRMSNTMARAMATAVKGVLVAGIILPTLMTRTQVPRLVPVRQRRKRRSRKIDLRVPRMHIP